VAATRGVAVHSELTVLVLKKTVEGVPVISEDTADATILQNRSRADSLVWKIVVRKGRGQTSNLP
jgi:hypothetical protein